MLYSVQLKLHCLGVSHFKGGDTTNAMGRAYKHTEHTDHFQRAHVCGSHFSPCPSTILVVIVLVTACLLSAVLVVIQFH